MSVLRGVDACKAGWICLSVWPGATNPAVRVFDSDARELLGQPALVTAIDIPIGLSTAEPRPVDGKARALLGSLKSSVFPAPVRAALGATTYEAACAASAAACGKRLSKQTYAILPRIRAVDAILRETQGLLESVYEVHPEVCFVFLNEGRALRRPKASGFGFVERLKMIEAVWGSAADKFRRAISPKDASDDDILDAFAALWTAQRIFDGKAVRIDETNSQDGFGMPMQMWA